MSETRDEWQARLDALAARLAPCPFCGRTLPADPDTLYPTNTPRHKAVWRGVYGYGVFCSEVIGGCGAEIHGRGATLDEAREAAIKAWNRRQEAA